MPEIVKICYASILRNACGHQVNLITQSNYKDYISNPPRLQQILECIRSGELTVTALSDIVHCYLLYNFGGVWIDVTILLADEIDNIITNNIFASCRRLPIRRNIAKLLCLRHTGLPLNHTERSIWTDADRSDVLRMRPRNVHDSPFGRQLGFHKQ